MSDSLPSLDELPTQPPPLIPRGESEWVERQPRTPRVRTRGSLWRVVALILTVQAALVSSAVLVAVERPSVGISLAAVVLTDAFMVVAFAMVLGLLGRR